MFRHVWGFLGWTSMNYFPTRFPHTICNVKPYFMGYMRKYLIIIPSLFLRHYPFIVIITSKIRDFGYGIEWASPHDFPTYFPTRLTHTLRHSIKDAPPFRANTLGVLAEFSACWLSALGSLSELFRISTLVTAKSISGWSSWDGTVVPFGVSVEFCFRLLELELLQHLVYFHFGAWVGAERSFDLSVEFCFRLLELEPL